MRPPRRDAAADPGQARRRHKTRGNFRTRRTARRAAAQVEAITTYGVETVTAALADALFGDRAWFAEHPGRNYRIRPAAAGEFGCHGTHSLVHQVLPGMRRRSCMHLDPGADDEAIEALIALLERNGGIAC